MKSTSALVVSIVVAMLGLHYSLQRGTKGIHATLTAEELQILVGQNPTPCENEYNPAKNFTWRDRCEKAAIECKTKYQTIGVPLPAIIKEVLGIDDWNINIPIGCDGDPTYEEACPNMLSINPVLDESGTLTDKRTVTCPIYQKQTCQAQLIVGQDITITIPKPPPMEGSWEFTYHLPIPRYICVATGAHVPNSQRVCPGGGGADIVYGANCGTPLN